MTKQAQILQQPAPARAGGGLLAFGPLRLVGLAIVLAGLCGLGALWWLDSQTETAWVALEAIPRYAPIAPDAVQAVEVPRRRAPEIALLGVAPAGRWATTHIPAGSLIAPGMVDDTPPERRVLGETMLPVGWRGYALQVGTALAPELQPGDLVDLFVYQGGEETAGAPAVPAEQQVLLLLQKLPLLKLSAGEGGVLAVLALKPQQALALDYQLAQVGARPLLLLSQDANPDLPPLLRLGTAPDDPALFGPVAPELQALEPTPSAPGAGE